ncbi:MAG: hypothetical protein E7408_02695 [Ruminococcaceae bacterium]|nr:hypothetical protein [Oscillospiraceae bacterium]
METILRKLAMTPAPSGCEGEICRMIQSLLPAADMQIDAHGSLLVHKKGSGDGTVILTAMDTPCLYVTYPEGGFSRFSSAGGLKPANGMAVLCEGNIRGTVGSDEKGPFIDTGSHTLSIGQWAVPVPSFYKVDDDICAGASMGQYAAMAAVIGAACKETVQDVWFVFATKSHIRQLSPTFMQKIKANRLISVEVSAANDTPAEKTVFASLGQGTTLRVKDEAMLSSPELLSVVADTPLKTYREVSLRRGVGGTVQKAYGGIKSVGLGIPTRYCGCGNEAVSLSDIQNTSALLAYILQ